MLLGVKLVEYVHQSLEPFNLNISISAWSDSTVALAWIQSTPSRFQIFIANRIAKVQRAFPVQNWKYVPTPENPADYCTRPVSPNDLLSLEIWWHGPNWIHEEPVTLPKQPQILENTEIQREVRKKEILALDYSSTPARQTGRRDPTAFADTSIQKETDHVDHMLPIKRWGISRKLSELQR